MPRRDGTGPMGTGAMTGRGAGFCNAAKVVGVMGGLGLGWRLGCRGGRGLGFRNNINSEDRKNTLNEQKNFLENSLNLIKEELEELEK